METATPQVAVITGASRGLGAGIANRLAERGFHLGLCSRTRPPEPPRANRVLCETVNVTDHAALEAFAQSVTDEIGPIDLWINNAGVLDPIGPLRDAPTEQLQAHVATNLLGTMWGTQIFAKLVHNRKEPGTLINISSGAARSIYEGWATYGATKAGVEQLTQIVAAEEQAAGLRAYAVAQGVIDTDMQALIRATPRDRFTNVDRFIELKASNAYNSPAWVADRLIELHNFAERPPAWADDAVAIRIPNKH